VKLRGTITQGRVSAIEHAKPGTTELRTLAAYVEALGGRLEIKRAYIQGRCPAPAGELDRGVS
jgi:hypothetical protein